MKFAVCEDNAKDRAQICEYLEASMERQGVDADLCEFETADALLEANKKTHFSIFFLDILMPGTSGMDAALKLRRAGNTFPIVFITISKDYLAQSYNVWAAHYIVKPIALEIIDEALSRCMKILAREEKTLEFIVGRHPEIIPYSEIMYIEGDNRNCLIHTTTGRTNPYMFIGKVWELLKEDSRFGYCHRRFIVNFDHAVLVQSGGIAMRNDVMVPLRRGDTKRVRRAWEDRKFEVAERRG